MARSQSWKNEWSFFLNDKGRREYNKLCKGCKKDCKQSFRAEIISCPVREAK